ncbi:MAG: hypothetical protein HC790_00425 [Acaryochloridaceae cyanobacterium CSU_3_4]|nr:hypothetical protein [Acaryochloridaceae cyanobacterium CSU_3_4]
MAQGRAEIIAVMIYVRSPLHRYKTTPVRETITGRPPNFQSAEVKFP